MFNKTSVELLSEFSSLPRVFLLLVKKNASQRTYLVLRSDIEQVESPDVCWDTRVGSIVTKHPHPTTLRKFVVFVIEVF